MKFNNHKQVLSVLSRNDELTISEISDLVNLSKTTINKIISHLVEKNYVIEAGKGESTDVGGKKPSIYKFNKDLKVGISIVTNTKSIVGAIHDLKGEILLQTEFNGEFDDYQRTLGVTVEIINKLIENVDKSAEDICGVAIACEGVIDSINGIIRYPIQHKHWGTNINFKKDLAALMPFKTEIYLENVCCYAGFKEIMNEEIHNLGSIVTINTLENTGGCVIRDNSLLKGKNGYIGEVGHLVVDYHSNIECTCGAKGCFEALVSPSNVLKIISENQENFPDSVLFKSSTAGPSSIEKVFEAADNNDPLAKQILDKIVYYFALVIHNISLLQDPDAIIIQGTYANSGDYFKNNLIQKINSFPFYKLNHNIKIYFSKQNKFNSFLKGAAFYIFHNYFNDDSLYV